MGWEETFMRRTATRAFCSFFLFPFSGSEGMSASFEAQPP